MAEAEPAAFVAPSEAPDSTYKPYMDVKPPAAAPSDYPIFKIPSTLPQPPFIDVDGIPNFRNLGGYVCYPKFDGVLSTRPYVIKPGFMYRCAHPTQVTSEGISTFVNTLKIKTIYDLRSAPEVARTDAAAAAAANKPTPVNSPLMPNNPATSIPNTVRHFNPVYEEQDWSPDALARKLHWYTTPNAQEHPDYSEGIVNAYRDISTHAVRAYTNMFRHILNTPNEPFVFHCTAGKDRTGVFSAMVLRLCNVPDDVITWEYAITEAGLGSWRDMYIDKMTGTGPKVSPAGNPVQNMTRAEAARICGSRAGNMRAYLRLILDGELGGVENYMTSLCGFSEAEVEQIRRNLVIEAQQAPNSLIIKPVAIPGWDADRGMQDSWEEAASDGQSSLGIDPNAGREKEEKVMVG